MPWIQNVSMHSVLNGLHFFEPHKTVCIRIQDFGNTNFLPAKYHDEFVSVYTFNFDDNDDPDSVSNISVEQAKRIASILTECLEKGCNIVVSCHAGICRSKAVADIGVLLGFQDTEMHGIPNILVKNRLKEQLGLTVDYSEVFKFVLPDWE